MPELSGDVSWYKRLQNGHFETLLTTVCCGFGVFLFQLPSPARTPSVFSLRSQGGSLRFHNIARYSCFPCQGLHFLLPTEAIPRLKRKLKRRSFTVMKHLRGHISCIDDELNECLCIAKSTSSVSFSYCIAADQPHSSALPFLNACMNTSGVPEVREFGCICSQFLSTLSYRLLTYSMS